jgi:hypothetical protein
VRRLVLAGTAPRGGRDIHLYTAGPIRDAAFDDAPTPASLLTLFFEKRVPTQNTYLLAEHLPNAKLSIYSDAGHGFLFHTPRSSRPR